MSSKLFCVVAGPRLGGKSTSAGTLPGKTTMLQAAVRETGSRSAVALAKKLGNDLNVVTFNDLTDFRTKFEAAVKSDVDNLFVDGYSAINDIRWGEADIQRAYKKNNFEAYGTHGQSMTEWMLYIKSAAEFKNVFLSCAMKMKQSKDKEDPDLVAEVKGQIAATDLTKYGEACVTFMVMKIDNKDQRVMITKEWNGWAGRIDGVLDEDNPQFCKPDLSIVLRLANGTYTQGAAS